jgi:DNA-binding protein H-NS
MDSRHYRLILDILAASVWLNRLLIFAWWKPDRIQKPHRTRKKPSIKTNAQSNKRHDTMDISRLSVSELTTLQKDIERELNQRRKSEADGLVNEFRRRAAELGLSLDDLVAAKGAGRASGSVRGKVAVKYRHPDDASLTWTGRGKRPRWIEAWLSGGKSLDQLAA